jgi:hypothetical protein
VGGGISPRHDFGCVFYIWVLDRALTLDSSYCGFLIARKARILSFTEFHSFTSVPTINSCPLPYCFHYCVFLPKN